MIQKGGNAILPLTSFDSFMDYELLCNRLRQVGYDEGLLMESSIINFGRLEYLTIECVKNNIAFEEDRTTVRTELLELWFPALTVVCDGHTMFKDLDLKVDEVLAEAGYPDFDEIKD